jgi:DNA-directed RNA polymerase specialized sigma24 family protein
MAARTLTRQIKKAKAEYRHDSQMRKWRHRTLEARHPIAFAEEPLPEGTGPRRMRDLVVEVLKENYERLLGFVQRRVDELAMSGRVPRNAIDPRDIVDQVAQTVLRHPGLHPRFVPYDRWCFSLAVGEIRKALAEHARRLDQNVPLDVDVSPEGDFALAEEHDPTQSFMDALEEEVEPIEATMREHVPDPNSSDPAALSGEHDILALVRSTTAKWPPFEREVFEMYYMEGLDARDIAVAYEQDEKLIGKTLRRTQARLRRTMTNLAVVAQPVSVPADQKEGFVARVAKIAGEEETD